MSTLNLENIKHPDSASNNISVDSSGNTIANNRLTIGTPATPQNSNTDLHIRSSVPFIEMTDTEGGYGRVYLSNGNMLFDADHGNTQSDSYMTFRVDDTERMRIDSAGRVTMPYQPRFMITNGSNTNGWNGNIFIGGSTKYNVGNHFNTTTGVFTAPITGYYQFYMCFSTSSTNNHYMEIQYNGTGQYNAVLAYTGTYSSASQTINIYMAANDTAGLYHVYSGSNLYGTTFGGQLVG